MTQQDLPQPSFPKDINDNQSSALSLIRKIREGALISKDLSSDDRQRCVAELIAQGLSISETAEILGVSERTIARDRSAIRERNALKQDPRLAEEIAGRLYVEAEAAIGRLRRIARDKSNSASDHINAEKTAWQILCELTGTLQSLGYLPTAAHQLNAKLTYGLDKGAQVESILAEIERIEVIQRDCFPQDTKGAERLEKTKYLVQQTIASAPITSPLKENIDDNK